MVRLMNHRFDRFCNKFGGTKHVLKDVVKDKYGKYHDDVIYEIINETLIGAEALVRWNSKTGGFISPADFIPVFEKNGFVYDVDKFIWEETCRCLRRWLDEGKKVVPVSVNVSRIDLYDPMLVDYLVDEGKLEIVCVDGIARYRPTQG